MRPAHCAEGPPTADSGAAGTTGDEGEAATGMTDLELTENRCLEEERIGRLLATGFHIESVGTRSRAPVTETGVNGETYCLYPPAAFQARSRVTRPLLPRMSERPASLAAPVAPRWRPTPQVRVNLDLYVCKHCPSAGTPAGAWYGVGVFETRAEMIAHLREAHGIVRL